MQGAASERVVLIGQVDHARHDVGGQHRLADRAGLVADLAQQPEGVDPLAFDVPGGWAHHDVRQPLHEPRLPAPQPRGLTTKVPKPLKYLAAPRVEVRVDQRAGPREGLEAARGYESLHQRLRARMKPRRACSSRSVLLGYEQLERFGDDHVRVFLVGLAHGQPRDERFHDSRGGDDPAVQVVILRQPAHCLDEGRGALAGAPAHAHQPLHNELEYVLLSAHSRLVPRVVEGQHPEHVTQHGHVYGRDIGALQRPHERRQDVRAHQRVLVTPDRSATRVGEQLGRGQ